MAAAATAGPAATPADGNGAPAKRSRLRLPLPRTKKQLLLVLGVVLALVLAGGGGGVFWLKKRAAAQQAAIEAEEEGGGDTAAAGAPAVDPQSPPAWLPLDPFIVNLADRDADRYAQIGITLELETGTSPDQIRAYMPAVRNTILLILAGKTSRDLLDRSGKEQLAEEIAREAMRPLGYQGPVPTPVQDAVAAAPAASAASAAASAAAEAKPKKKKTQLASQKNLIRRVHFSSFIVQ